MLGIGVGIKRWQSSAAFNPLSLTPFAWYDVSDTSTLFEENSGGGSTPSTVGGVVGTIRDKSGNNRHLQAESAAARPLLQQSGATYYLNFDGVNDVMGTGSDETLASTHEITAGVLITTPSTGQNAGIFQYSNGIAGTTQVELAAYYDGSSLRIRTLYPSIDTFADGNILAASTNFVLGQARVTTSDHRQYKNGALVKSIATASGAFTTPRRLRIGRHTNASQYYAGRIYGLVITAPLTDAERTNLTAWLAARSEVTL